MAQASEVPVLDLAALEAAASAVPDPELPVVTLGDLGIVRGVAVAGDGAVEVRLTPTFVGCPATEAIAADVRAAVEARLRADGETRGGGDGVRDGSGGAGDVWDRGGGGVGDGVAAGVVVRTRMVMSPPWSTDWISDDGRRKLAEHGIAPPRGGRGGGPVAVTIGRRAGGQDAAAGGESAAGVLPSSPFPSPHPPAQQNHPQASHRAQPCPQCGSADTRELSAFGSTPCQSLRACRACGEPFGAMKSL